jgi:hypothetical protein
MDGRQFSPAYQLERPFIEGMAPIFSLHSLHPFLDFLLSNIVFGMLPTLLNRVIILVRAPNPGSSSMSLFHFSLPFEDFL